MPVIKIGPNEYLDTTPLDFGPPPEWWMPHAPEPEIRRYATDTGPTVSVKPCWCPLPADHPLHVSTSATPRSPGAR